MHEHWVCPQHAQGHIAELCRDQWTTRLCFHWETVVTHCKTCTPLLQDEGVYDCIA